MTIKPLPPMGRYVIAHVPSMPWLDDSDNKGVFYVVAKRVLAADNQPNNLGAGYEWHTFGPARFFAHDVDDWFELPDRGEPCKSN